MRTLNNEEKIELENKAQYIEDKAKLLAEYKSYEEDIAFANDEFEEELINDKRAKLATQIRDLGSKLKNIESLENLV